MFAEGFNAISFYHLDHNKWWNTQLSIVTGRSDVGIFLLKVEIKVWYISTTPENKKLKKMSSS